MEGPQRSRAAPVGATDEQPADFNRWGRLLPQLGGCRADGQLTSDLSPTGSWGVPLWVLWGVAFWRLRCGAVGVEVLTCGADSGAVQGKPRNALRLQAAKASWADVLCNGSVVNGGDPDYGGGTHRQ